MNSDDDVRQKTGSTHGMSEKDDAELQRVEDILKERFDDRVFSVEDDVVWVSGINSDCVRVARQMAQTLAHGHDIPAGLVHDDGAVKFGGVQFNWGESA